VKGKKKFQPAHREDNSPDRACYKGRKRVQTQGEQKGKEMRSIPGVRRKSRRRVLRGCTAGAGQPWPVNAVRWEKVKIYQQQKLVKKRGGPGAGFPSKAKQKKDTSRTRKESKNTGKSPEVTTPEEGLRRLRSKQRGGEDFP